MVKSFVLHSKGRGLKSRQFHFAHKCIFVQRSQGVLVELWTWCNTRWQVACHFFREESSHVGKHYCNEVHTLSLDIFLCLSPQGIATYHYN
uniref:Uncharacterized protein n=1 Tax=Arion vulgaris TaxID=1028688 RepID=A0A0B7AQD9_9EUPU